MKFDFITLNNKKNIIDGVILFPIKITRDDRGFLAETSKNTWKKVFDKEKLPLVQSYFSLTYPGKARDENRWHCHPRKQTDRFIVIKGLAIFAVYDWREKSPTFGKLNLFLMGNEKKEQCYMLTIPVNLLHSFSAIGKEPAILLGFPSLIYNPKEEKRIFFKDVEVNFPEGTAFSWDTVRNSIK